MPCSHVNALCRKIPEYHSQHADGGPHLHSLLGSLLQGHREQTLGTASPLEHWIWPINVTYSLKVGYVLWNCDGLHMWRRPCL